MKTTLITIVALLVFVGLQAQTDKALSGYIKDSSNNPVKGATVHFYATNAQMDSLKSISNEKGVFTFKNIPALDFKIIVSFSGYANYSRIYHYSEGGDKIVLPPIQLGTNIQMLEEVIVIADRTVTIKEDTLEFKADSFKLRPDADVEALLKRIPGVQVDASGNITAYGKSVTKIRVNGKDFFSGDSKTATRELPANIVDVIQVIDDYGDQAAFTGVKDGDPEKIINIKIKKDKNKGYFGRGQIGYGTEARYNANGSINYFNNTKQVSVLTNFNNTNASLFSMPGQGGGIGGMMRGGMPDNGQMNTMNTVMSNGDAGFLQSGNVSNNGISSTNSIGINYRDDWGEKMSIYGSYTFNDRQINTISNSQQTNLFETGNIANLNNSNKFENSYGHRFFFNAEWRIDSFNQVKISTSLAYTKSNANTQSDFLFNGNNNTKLNEGNSADAQKYTQPTINTTILYNHRFHKTGRLFSAVLTAGYTTTEQEDDRVNNSIFYTPAGSTFNKQHQLLLQENTNPSGSIRFSYIEPLSKKKSLEFNYTYSHSLADNERQTLLVNNGSTALLDSLSNVFENKFDFQRYGINYRYNDRKYNYSIGLAAQGNQLNGKSFNTAGKYNNSSFNWFPLARLTYNFSRTKSFTLSYTGNITAPGSSQLQPIYDYSNPQYPVIGNPNLKPEFVSTFSARYNNFDFASGNMLFSNISGSFTSDKIVANSINKTNQGGGAGSTNAIQETQYQNADGTFNLTGFYNFSKPFQNRKYTLTFNGNLNYAQNISFINSNKNSGKNFIVTQGINLDVRINTWFEMGGGGSFSYNQTKNSLLQQANTNVSTYSLNSNGKIYLPAKLVLNYDLSKSINDGFGVSANPFIINGYIERQFAKNNQWSIRAQAFDLLNQNTSISRTVNANSITDTRTNRLGRYFLLSLNFRLQKFKGEQPKTQFPSGPPPDGPPPLRMGI